MVERGIWGAYFFLALALLSFWGGLILLGMKVITILDKDLGYARIVMIWGYCYKATNIRVPGTATPSLRKLKRTVKSSDFYDVEIEYPGFMSARNLGTFDLSAQAELAINEVLQWKETRG